MVEKKAVRNGPGYKANTGMTAVCTRFPQLESHSTDAGYLSAQEARRILARS